LTLANVVYRQNMSAAVIRLWAKMTIWVICCKVLMLNAWIIN